MLAVPNDRRGQPIDGQFECIVFIESMGQRHFLPGRIVKTGLVSTRSITYKEFPPGIETVPGTLIPLLGPQGGGQRKREYKKQG